MWLGLLIGFLLILFVIQLACAWLYARRLHAAARQPVPTADQWPSVTVFVPVRGGGAHWQQALEHLLSIDYPDLRVRVVVDHPSDPAAQVIQAILARRSDNRLQMEFLRQRASHRSLLCSGLIQVVESLDDSCELLAFCGADMHLPQSFFREMVAPMFDPQVGSTLGNRWYQPQVHSWGSILRYLWNCGAVVPMWLTQIPWGGAAVLRLEDIRRSALLQAWSTGMVEDAPIKPAMQKLGLTMKFVPKLLVFHDDAIRVGDCYEFIKRQVLWTRLYHPNWFLVIVNAIVGTTAMFLPWLAALVMLVLGAWDMAAVCLAAGVLYWLSQAFLLVLVERAARRIARANEQPQPPMSWLLRLKILLAIPGAQVLHATSVLASSRLRRVRWSGIEYEIRGPHAIQRMNYFPLQLPDAGAEPFGSDSTA